MIHRNKRFNLNIFALNMFYSVKMSSSHNFQKRMRDDTDDM